MHQQIRLKLGVMDESDGSGAMTVIPVEHDPIEVRKRLLDLLDTLEGAGFDLLMVGGRDIETSGDFVFAVADDLTSACAQLLLDRGYRGVRILEPAHGHAAHGPGGLATAIREMNLGSRRIHEIFIGIEQDGAIPVQVTTFAGSGEADAAV
jgi:hypothetical protein